MKSAGIFLVCLSFVACTSTAPVISSAQPGPRSVHLRGARVAVLPFSGAPDHPETGRAARDIAISVLVKNYGAVLVSPSRVDSYVKEKAFSPSEYDPEGLSGTAAALEADIVLWGDVQQFTPYRFDRMAPATPPYVDLTIFALSARSAAVVKASGHKQGGLPATIWARQPTFQDVAQSIILELISRLAR